MVWPFINEKEKRKKIIIPCFKNTFTSTIKVRCAKKVVVTGTIKVGCAK